MDGYRSQLRGGGVERVVSGVAKFETFDLLLA
jgi:hypothetical protein